MVSHFSLLLECPGAWYTYSMNEAQAVRELIGSDRGRTVFLEHDVKGLFREIGFDVPRGIFIRTGETLPKPLDLSYPLLAKVSSSKITSKSNIGGVRGRLRNEEELERAVRDLSGIAEAEGVLVEEMAPEGLEVIVGGVIDNQFGPVVMFGLGGIFVELFKDIAFALAPLASEDALWLIKQVRGYRLLEGCRGRPPVDKALLLRIIMSVSEIMALGVVREIDLNPVTLYEDGAIILDAKMQIFP